MASGHICGGAVDVNLLDRDGNQVRLEHDGLTDDQKTTTFARGLPDDIRANRRILFTAMYNQGLLNYRKEYWHFDRDVYRSARQLGLKNYRYGPVENPPTPLMDFKQVVEINRRLTEEAKTAK